MTKDMIKSKTVWAGVATVVTALGGFFTGAMGATEAIQLGVTGVTAIFLRHGISKAGESGKPAEFKGGSDG